MAFLALFAAQTAAADGKVFDTADNPAAHGLSLQVRCPEKWKVLKPKGNVFFAAGYGKDNVAEILELRVNPIKRQEARALFAMKGGLGRKTREGAVARYFKKQGGLALLAFEDTVVGEYPAVVVNLERSDETGPQPLFTRVKKKLVYARGKMVLLDYVVMARPENREKVVKRQEEGEAGDAGMFFESLAFKKQALQERQEGGRK